MKNGSLKFIDQSLMFVVLNLVVSLGCTGQLPNSFRLAQVEQTFGIVQEINTKIDLLWVVDNSASMDVSQQKIRAGFSGFARKYLQPTWDIRVAVITTDTFMAHSAFQGFTNTIIPQTQGWRSSYIYNRLETFVNPEWNLNLVNLSTGRFDAGVAYGDRVPVWGSSYAKLLPGLHDGPIPALCSELSPYFFKGPTKCAIRDNQSRAQGVEKCLNPNLAAGESSVTECVNTIQNDTIHTGRPILSTLPPEGIAADSRWIESVINDFIINVSVGSSGQGSERGLGSVLQLLSDNESEESAFFRRDSLRGIIFVSDEDDQTMELPVTPPADFKPQTYYKCDQASLESLNGLSVISGTNGYCCADPAKNCSFGSEGVSCPSKTVDGFTYTLSVCLNPDLLTPVSEVKDELDRFFRQLDGGTSEDLHYFIVSIVPLTSLAIQSLQAARALDDAEVGVVKTTAVDRGDRYLELGSLVQNGSLSMNIAEEDYSPLLDAIGKTIIEKKSTFRLERAPTKVEDMIVKIIHQDGSATILSSDKFLIQEKSLLITDESLVLGLKSTDRMVINYQPKTIF